MSRLIQSIRKPALFALTALSTTVEGAVSQHADGVVWPLSDGLRFSVPLLSILVVRELAQAVAARIAGVPASWPSFIPLPPTLCGIGTLGSITPRRTFGSAQAMVTTVGLFAGVLMAMAVLWHGLSRSAVLTWTGVSQEEGSSIAYLLLKHQIKGLWLPTGHLDFVLEPMALAGWVGLMLMGLHALPIGQLAGGQLAAAALGKTALRLGRVAHGALLVVGFLGLLAGGIMFERELGGGHATSWGFFPACLFLPVVYFTLRLLQGSSGVLDPPLNLSEPSGPARLAFAASLVLSLILFVPIPFRPKYWAPIPAPTAQVPASPVHR